MAWAVTVLARGEVVRACSEEGALGSEGRAGGEWWKEFLRMPRGGCLDSCSLMREWEESVPFGRWAGEEMCMVGDTWAIFGLCKVEAGRRKSPSKPVLYAEKWWDRVEIDVGKIVVKRLLTV